MGLQSISDHGKRTFLPAGDFTEQRKQVRVVGNCLTLGFEGPFPKVGEVGIYKSVSKPLTCLCLFDLTLAVFVR